MDDGNGSLERLLSRLEDNAHLREPRSFRARSEALDSLDGHVLDAAMEDAATEHAAGEDLGLGRRVRALRARLEAVNSQLYEEIRAQVVRGAGARALQPWVGLACSHAGPPEDGFGYDALDELMGGVLQLDEPEDEEIDRKPETVFYQPTPARHILRMIDLARLAGSDVVVDLGSGLGHVVLLTSICTGTRCIGIELELGYVESARRCAEGLNVRSAEFLHQDARAADLSMGTVFYLHTPFSGTILETVLGRLRGEAAKRALRICTFGPCTAAVAGEGWLEAEAAPRADRIALFRSRT